MLPAQRELETEQLSDTAPEDEQYRPFSAADAKQPWVPKARMGPYRLVQSVKLDVFIAHGLELELPENVTLRMRFYSADPDAGEKTGLTVTARPEPSEVEILVGMPKATNALAPRSYFAYSTNMIPLYVGWNAFLVVSVIFPGAGLVQATVALWERPE